MRSFVNACGTQYGSNSTVVYIKAGGILTESAPFVYMYECIPDLGYVMEGIGEITVGVRTRTVVCARHYVGGSVMKTIFNFLKPDRQKNSVSCIVCASWREQRVVPKIIEVTGGLHTQLGPWNKTLA